MYQRTQNQTQVFQTHCRANLIFSNDRDYKSKIRDKKKKYWKRKKQDPNKFFAKLTEHFLTKAYESNIIELKFDEDLLQRRIYFLTFI